MAVISNTSLSYDMGDKKVYSSSADEAMPDVAKLIMNISPTETPFVSAIGTRDCQNTIFEWLTDDLAATSTTADVEADQTTRAAITHATRLSNICQIMSRNASVSGTQQRIAIYGKSEGQLAYQLTKRSKELKRSMEAVLTSNQARNNGASGTARTTATLGAWLTTNTSFDSTSGADPVTVGSTARTDSSAQRALTATLINTVAQSCFTNGGEPDMLMVGPYNKTVVSTLTGRSIARELIDSDRAGANVSVFATDFGDLAVKPNRFMRERDAYLVDDSMCKVAYLRNFETERLGKIGDEETAVVRCEFGLEVTEEAGLGGIFDLTTS
jgi:hypothetical protein